MPPSPRATANMYYYDTLQGHDNTFLWLKELDTTHKIERLRGFDLLVPKEEPTTNLWYLVWGFPLVHVLEIEPSLRWFGGSWGETIERVKQMALRKALSLLKASEASASAPEVPEGVLSACPTLWEFLSVTVIDGKPRQTSTMSLWVSEGDITLCLNERDAGLSMYSGGSTLEEALTSLERKLNSESPEWRKGYSRSGKAKK